MLTTQTNLKRTPSRREGMVPTAVGALITLAVVVVFLALAGHSRGLHTPAGHATPTYYPLIQYRGTGAAPASTATTRPTPAPVGQRKSYGAVP